MTHPEDGDTATEVLESVERLSKDLRQAAETMGPKEIGFLVDGYYAIQEYRKAAANQVRAAKDAGEPARILEWISGQAETLESRIKSALDRWTAKQAAGKWMRSLVGIGPVLSAGLLAHLDIGKAPTAGHFWSFAGLDPNVEWVGREGAAVIVKECCGSARSLSSADVGAIETKLKRRIAHLLKPNEDGRFARKDVEAVAAKRPWNARLKTLLWKVGDSFVKFHNRDDCFYGKLYAERKFREVTKNEAGDFKDIATATLEKKSIKEEETKKCYEAGKLPPGRIDLRARRWAEKIFLSHLHEVMWFLKHGTGTPKPYIMAKEPELHTRYIDVPNQEELPPGFKDRRKA